MRVQDVMTDGVVTISPTVPAQDAWDAMGANRIRHVVVMDGSRVVGVLSNRDVGGSRGSAVRRNRTVAELMTTHIVTVSPTTSVRKAADLMRGRSIGCLVVLKAKRVVGIVTVTDLLELLGRGAERPVATSPRRIITHRSPHRKRDRAAGVW